MAFQLAVALRFSPLLPYGHVAHLAAATSSCPSATEPHGREAPPVHHRGLAVQDELRHGQATPRQSL